MTKTNPTHSPHNKSNEDEANEFVTKGYFRQELAAAEERITQRVSEQVTQRVTEQVTKQVTEQVVKLVGEQVGALLSDALDMISARFDRIERKLDALVKQVDDHSVRINHLEQKLGM
jgi:hypothetical protein